MIQTPSSKLTASLAPPRKQDRGRISQARDHVGLQPSGEWAGTQDNYRQHPYRPGTVGLPWPFSSRG